MYYAGTFSAFLERHEEWEKAHIKRLAAQRRTFEAAQDKIDSARERQRAAARKRASKSRRCNATGQAGMIKDRQKKMDHFAPARTDGKKWRMT